nr:energy transducer TonB [Roseococcus suduntuyensis]
MAALPAPPPPVAETPVTAAPPPPADSPAEIAAPAPPPPPPAALAEAPPPQTEPEPEPAPTPVAQAPAPRPAPRPVPRRAAAPSAAPPTPTQVSGPATGAPAATSLGAPAGPSAPPRPDAGFRNAGPAYPEMARQRGQQGAVVLDLRVDAEGRVVGAEVAQSSGHPMLDAAARRAVLNWRFRPALDGGRPVEAHLRSTVRFRLD